MESGKSLAVGLAATGAALAVAAVITLVNRDSDGESWQSDSEGFVAIASGGSAEIGLWKTLNTETPDGKPLRPASVDEVAQWLDAWPYHARDGDEPLSVALQSSEVRCSGAASGEGLRPGSDDRETLVALRDYPGCTYARWRVWSGETADRYLNERHTVWTDAEGFFHGRVDYWK